MFEDLRLAKQISYECPVTTKARRFLFLESKSRFPHRSAWRNNPARMRTFQQPFMRQCMREANEKLDLSEKVTIVLDLPLQMNSLARRIWSPCFSLGLLEHWPWYLLYSSSIILWVMGERARGDEIQKYIPKSGSHDKQYVEGGMHNCLSYSYATIPARVKEDRLFSRWRDFRRCWWTSNQAKGDGLAGIE